MGSVGWLTTPPAPPAEGAGGEGPPFPVSPRQAQILDLIAEGLADKEIAVRLGISYRTVRTHMERLTEATGIFGRTALVAAWLRRRNREHPAP